MSSIWKLIMENLSMVAISAEVLFSKVENGKEIVSRLPQNFLTSSELDTLYDEVEYDIVKILEKKKFNKIFELETLMVGSDSVDLAFIYKGVSKNIRKLSEELTNDATSSLHNLKLVTEDDKVIVIGDFSLKSANVGDMVYTVKYDECHMLDEADCDYNVQFSQHRVELGPDATVGQLVTQFAKDMNISRKEYNFRVFNSYGEEVIGFQKRLRKCCFDGALELRKSPKSPKSPKSTKSTKSPRKNTGPKSPRYKPVSRPSSVDRNRLVKGRATKKSNAYTIKEIGAFLKERGLKQSGNKAEMIDRLLQNM